MENKGEISAEMNQFRPRNYYVDGGHHCGSLGARIPIGASQLWHKPLRALPIPLVVLGPRLAYHRQLSCWRDDAM